MIYQSAATLATNSNTFTSAYEVGNNVTPELYKNIANDFSIRQKHKQPIINNTLPIEPNIDDVFPVVSPKPKEADYSFSVLQEWEGYVISISGDYFTARIVDLYRKSRTEEEADFDLSDLNEIDKKKICEGAIFRWIIGYHRSPVGTKDRTSRIVFRNLPAWTKKELEDNELAAKRISSAIKIE